MLDTRLRKPKTLLGSLVAALLAVVLSVGMLGAPNANATPEFPPGYPVIGQSGDAASGHTVVGAGEGSIATRLFPVWTGPDALQLAYCVELRVSAHFETPGHVGGWDSFPGTNNFAESQEVRERVAWMVYNSYPLVSLDEFSAITGIPDVTEQEAISGTQSAIWNLTDDFEFAGLAGDHSSESVARVQAVYDFMLSDVNTGRPETSGPMIEMTAPSGEGTAGQLVGPIVIEASEATVAVDLETDVDAPIALVDSQGSPVDLAAAPTGVELFLDVPIDTPAGSVTLSGTVTGPETTGLLVSNTSPRNQTFMIARSDQTTREATAAVSWAAKPRISTTALDAEDGDKYLDPTGEVTVIDTVAYAGLIPGEEYELQGELMIRGDGDVEIPTGITASKTFVPSSPEGEETLSFTIDAGDLVGEVIVVFEELFHGGISVAAHADIKDRGQTVYRPFIGTTAVGDDGSKLLPESGETVIVDTVNFAGLHVGETYRLEGELMTRDEDGSAQATGITAEDEFTPTTSSGTVDLTFTVADGQLDGETIVVFERLFHGETLIAEHTDIEDEFQTVYRPRIGTSADDGNGSDYLDPEGDVTVVDIVSYSGLEPGHEYTVEGELMIRTTDDEAVPTGITASETFTPEHPSGSVELQFSIPASELVGEVIVVFEELYRDDVLIAAHADITDRHQTVYRPDLGTTAVDGEDGDQFLPEFGEATVVDTVRYSGLHVGQTYTIDGELMLRTDDGGQPTGITNSITFVPEESNGEIDLTFTIPEGELLGEVIVVFEYLSIGGVQVAAHADIEDEAQTVYRPEIDTYAYNLRTGEQLLDPEGATLRDDLSYRGLEPGLTYVARGEVMLHETGESTGITGETVFVPTAPDGIVHVDFEVPSGYAGETLVVFEWLYLVTPEDAEETDAGQNTGDVPAAAISLLQMLLPQQEQSGELLLATHTDLNAASQTVQVDTPPEAPLPDPTPTESSPDASSPEIPRTGFTGSSAAWPLAALLMLVGAGLAWAFGRRKMS
ncbi:VaFE repeat-containing surface-anchored protein [uncultured Agrococcus sp.]|uniref:VaFE repeat-containing surface-anchored protein n=1 Tax=uncultured Agrococcus sp. TaxID=382258 RepID=UPI0026002CC7|nr:VaFE repeat-containing surface-anchored protein [uncultured Agrococcus sp.]